MRPGRTDIYRVPVMLNEGCRGDRSEESRVYLPHNIESMTPWVNQTQSGNVLGTNLLAPYGQVMPPSSTNDPYVYANLFQDTEYGGDDAWYRNYSAEQTRWLRPDPYNGSYDLNNPQSFNRYVYVNGNPLNYVDPSGLADGIVNGAGGSPCTASGETVSFMGGYSFNPCDPALSVASDGIYGVMQAFGFAGTASEVAPIVGAAFTIFCSIDSNKAACGPSGWTSVVFGQGSVAGKVVEDSIAAVGAAFGVECASSGPFALANPGCGVVLAYAIYTALNDLFSVFWDLFGPPQFTGSLLPRPSDLGGLGTAPIGIPNQNLSIKSILGHPSSRKVPSPGLKLP